MLMSGKHPQKYLMEQKQRRYFILIMNKQLYIASNKAQLYVCIGEKGA